MRSLFIYNLPVFKAPVLLSVLFLYLFSACKKDNFDAEKQAQIDEELISDFIAEKNISAQRHSSGIYYQILAPGSGNVTYTANTTVAARYTGRFLSGTAFDGPHTTPVSFPLGRVIAGWQIGIPLIQKGGKIRLLIPSGLAYGPDGYLSIPPNTVLDFEVELADVIN